MKNITTLKLNGFLALLTACLLFLAGGAYLWNKHVESGDSTFFSFSQKSSAVSHADFGLGATVNQKRDLQGQVAAAKLSLQIHHDQKSVLQSLIPTTLVASSETLLEMTAETCVEGSLTVEESEALLQIPSADLAQGQLKSVVIHTEAVLNADIAKKMVNTNAYQTGISADLIINLPDGSTLELKPMMTYGMGSTSADLRENGFSVEMSESVTKEIELVDNLDAFFGDGMLEVRLAAIDLVDYQSDNTSISSEMTAIVCVEYIYE